ncbi:MAG: sugar ABC transporter permease [Candidatus Gastranaerophilales bacterium]|nr:sugar ABC transporter permease [Candidatus Gastranaerophilales bacterium]
MKKFLYDEKYVAWLFLAPALLGTLIFIIIPICASFYISLLDWNLINVPNFVGFQNYIEIFNEKIFGQILLNTVIYAIITTIFAVIIPLVLAVMLNEKIKCANAFKTLYFLPYITPMIVLAVVWAWIFDPNYGVFNFIFHTHIKWLYDTRFAMIALIFVSVWKNIGYNMILMLAGLQNIPDDVNEAAEIDGATGVSKFLKVTCPMLSPTILFVSLITTISSFQVFDLIFLMTQGGPENSTSVLVYYMYKNAFEFFKIGKASAIAYVLFGIILILSAIQWFSRKKWVYNE